VAATVDGNAAAVNRNRRAVQEHKADIARRTGRPTPPCAFFPRYVFMLLLMLLLFVSFR